MLAVANERGKVPDDPNKRDPLDFVLWQAAKPGEPTWDSPWGPGRPGWHIECTAMAMKVLGPTVDIHGGGADLIFPHHECEIAQSENATGVSPFARYWMHVGMVEYQGEKMSKSLGNLVIASQVLREATRRMDFASTSSIITIVRSGSTWTTRSRNGRPGAGHARGDRDAVLRNWWRSARFDRHVDLFLAAMDERP